MKWLWFPARYQIAEKGSIHQSSGAIVCFLEREGEANRVQPHGEYQMPPIPPSAPKSLKRCSRFEGVFDVCAFVFYLLARKKWGGIRRLQPKWSEETRELIKRNAARIHAGRRLL